MTQTVISYIPALHKGYIDFFEKYPGNLFILSTEFVHQVPRMERDIRALDPEMIQEMVASLGVMHDVAVLDKAQLQKLSTKQKVVMPDEDVNRAFAKKYLLNYDVEFISVFLRWDQQLSTIEFEVPPDRLISTKKRDKELIGQAFAEAEKSPDWWRQVGAVIVKEGKPLLVGHNKPFPSEDYTMNIFGDPRSNFDAGISFDISKAIHAEACIISEAARRGIPLDGTSIYVTTFPCPVCAKSLAVAGIKKVYYSKGYSLLDAEDVLRAHDVEIVLVKD